MLYLLLYISISLTFAFVVMTNLENLRHTPVKLDPKMRNKTNEKIKELKADLYLSIFWPWLLFKKFKNEYYFRKQD